DVLENYTTYKSYWRLLKKIEDDPRYDKKKAEYLLKSFVELHPHAIGEKVKICVEHFAAKARGEIGGKAKAMMVTRSRLHAVRYRLAVDKYLAERARRQWRAGQLGSHERPWEDRGADAGDRSAARYDGPGTHGNDGRQGGKGTISLLPERQSPGYV
ncbi:MAG: hypothetical protein HY650_13280, partial [Acidobacteria bacterium]|nr:hypothetical protein [Acidobacteriota bacterium]